MLDDKTKTMADFKSLREYFNYLMTGKSLEDHGYNRLLKHSHPANDAPLKQYRNYRAALMTAAYQRLLSEGADKNALDTLFRKYYFLNNEPMTYSLKAPVHSLNELNDALKKYHADLDKLSREKYGMQPVSVNGEESCYLCKRTKRVFVVEEFNNNREYLALCPHVYNEMLETSNIARRFMNKSFNSFVVEENNKAAFTSLKTYADNFDTVLKTGESLLLMGPVGTGKSHLGVAVLLDLIYKPMFLRFKLLNMLYISLPAFLTELRATQEEMRLKNASESEFLIIDDLGIETLDDWGREKVFTLINKRYQEKLPTVFISDLSPAELVGKLDERIISRLHEMCRGVMIGGADKRRMMQ